jgi:pimeloyl-ACP methyl ester carboxylesterase
MDSSEVNGRKPAREIFPYQPDQINPVVFSSFLGHLPQIEITDQLNSISNETLVLWGEQDTLIPYSWGEQLAALLPKARFQVAAGEYHNLASIDTPALAATMIHFLG